MPACKLPSGEMGNSQMSAGRQRRYVIATQVREAMVRGPPLTC